MSETRAIGNNFGSYFDFPKWLEDNRKELQLRLLLLQMREIFNQNYLAKYFVKMDSESDIEYEAFIFWVNQGILRKKKEVEKRYGRRFVAQAAKKYRWLERAHILDEELIDKMIIVLNLKNMNGDHDWLQKGNENDFEYFLFLCYLYLGSEFSFNQIGTILLEHNITGASTLSVISGRKKWSRRRTKYYNLLEKQRMWGQYDEK